MNTSQVKTEQSSIVLSQAAEMLKIYADWLDMQQAYVRFLEDCLAYYGRIFN